MEVREQRGGYKELLAIEYWYAYLYNDWKSVHEMDWEEIVVVLKVDGQKKEEPTACACLAHHGGYRLRWSRIEKSDDSGHRNSEGTHPIIYVAQGSHANYFYGGQSYTTTAEIFNTLFIRSGKFPFTGEFMDFVAYFDEGDRRLIEAVLIPPPTQHTIDVVGAYFPAVLGALTIIPIYFIGKELFNQAQARLRKNRELASRNSKREYLLSGYVFCQHCGRRYCGWTATDKTKSGVKYRRYYRCPKGYKIISPIQCPGQPWLGPPGSLG